MFGAVEVAEECDKVQTTINKQVRQLVFIIYTDRGCCLCDLASEFQTDGTENVADQAILRSYHRGQAGS